jgi:hypothetical protein
MCYTPNNHFNLPLSAEALDYTLPTSVETAHGDYPIYRDSSDFGPRVLHSGCALTICRPLITLAAKHLYFARRELVPQACPPHAPLNRATIEPGRQFVGPTHEDIAEFNAHKGAKLYPAHGFNALDSACRDSQAPSARWDYDWERMLSCCDPWAASPFAGPVSPVGALNGLWGGRMSVSESPLLALAKASVNGSRIFRSRMFKPIICSWETQHDRLISRKSLSP